jgi:hypothetical protein
VNNVMFGIIESLLELGLAEKHLNWYRGIYKVISISLYLKIFIKI